MGYPLGPILDLPPPCSLLVAVESTSVHISFGVSLGFELRLWIYTSILSSSVRPQVAQLIRTPDQQVSVLVGSQCSFFSPPISMEADHTILDIASTYSNNAMMTNIQQPLRVYRLSEIEDY